MVSQVASLRKVVFVCFWLFGTIATTPLTGSSVQVGVTVEAQPVYEAENEAVLRKLQALETSPSLPASTQGPPEFKPLSNSRLPPTSASLADLRSALFTAQDQYFSLWLGKWTTAIDWTAAVMGTYISATLTSLSDSLDYILPSPLNQEGEFGVDAQMIENEINGYFGQSVASYYGEEAFSIRTQAYDDMLWVVLEWLESIKFINSHTSNHFASSGAKRARWHGQQFVPTFAHRARIFYDLANKGWDSRLCGGGMTWNPRLLPYKNAITNQLYISASINMYLHFPGDRNCSPFYSTYTNITTCVRELQNQNLSKCHCIEDSEKSQYNSVFRRNAIKGYDWLKDSGMLNDKGLYTDGFHIRDYSKNKSATTCNERNEMVYTYNQGVILSGLRGLWEATGNTTYLLDGYALVDNVSRATGWTKDSADDRWYGLGSNGILTEACDPSGSCNQDGQTFKGIFFHHLTAFCEPLPRIPVRPGSTYAANENLARDQKKRCDSYTNWVVHNAQAAMGTRDSKGRFGSWWAAPSKSTKVLLPRGAIDYRNLRSLIMPLGISPAPGPGLLPVLHDPDGAHFDENRVLETRRYNDAKPASSSADLNDRGRGRTVETQSSGVAVVRAMYEFLKRAEMDV